jgi:hypothetical protein
MPARFVNIDHATPMLLPPDLRDWVSPNHMVHFIMDAVVALDLSLARVNGRGTGSAQYPPSMMLGLLIYCYATGTFASRRIETLTFENVAVRYLTGDTHPDHDSICKFRLAKTKTSFPTPSIRCSNSPPGLASCKLATSPWPSTAPRSSPTPEPRTQRRPTRSAR